MRQAKVDRPECLTCGRECAEELWTDARTGRGKGLCGRARCAREYNGGAVDRESQAPPAPAPPDPPADPGPRAIKLDVRAILKRGRE